MVAVANSADIERFRTDGFFLADGLFSAAECDAMAERIESAAFELALGHAEEGPLSYRPMMHLADEGLARWATDHRWATIVRPLLPEGARLYWEQAVVKPPQARTELPWHQDSGYTPLVPEEYVTCWLALDDADEQNGCLWLQPGSQHDGRQPHHDDGRGGPFRVGHDGPTVDGVAVPVHRGSVLVFSSLLMHKSGPNLTDGARRAWIIQYCPIDARSALSGNLLDDRLQVSDGAGWFDTPVRQRDFDLLAVLANYDQR
ncbi:MAG TPA: phytanoyl-CoA dioxygenase family protein [Acidimicrobiales bacterium]|nr:phytanoyl-CoA dioxygenase family protein [Acidimicrobiales bacterium]